MTDEAMNVLVIGGGGREHALCWKLRQSPRCAALFCAPGNAGIADVATCVAVDPVDHAAVIAFCREQAIGFVVVGPEAPLVDGLVDSLGAAGIRSFGPTKAAARLEGSKGFTKDLCARFGIPTAAYARFDDAAAAKAYAAAQPLPVVVKADGLAAGKGVVIAESHAEAADAIDAMFAGGHGSLVIEEFMTGEEASFFALVDGTSCTAFGSAQDHKRVGDGDTGPNTGGMGAYSPAPVMTAAMEARVMAEIVAPTARAMAEIGSPFSGVLFAGLMITADGPKLIEYNTRFGDPECEVLMARLDADLVSVLLGEAEPRLAPAAALTVVLAANGYPGTPEKGTVICGADDTGALVFHAGTARSAAGDLIATGGRVLAVTGIADSVTAAQRAAYQAVDRIDWPGGFCRRDIGWRAVEREARR
jgi:phosphoribosylamine--glycine ligase